MFDSSYDQYRGVVAFIRVIDGSFRAREPVLAMAQGTRFEAEEVGFFSPTMQPADTLTAGEVGYLITGLKDVARLRVGETLTSQSNPASEPLPGYRDVKPMVFAGLFPTDSDDYPELRDALERLKLNDASLSYEPETSQALGFGFRSGFLGLLHMEIVRERLEREFDLDLLVTAPTVAYRVETPTGELVEVHNPADMPDDRERVEEPYVRASIIVPKDGVGQVMELATERRGRFDHMEYLSPERVLLLYELPLGEIVFDFYDQLKSRTRGYASFDYDYAGFREGELVRLDVLVGGEPVDALSLCAAPGGGVLTWPFAGRPAPRGDPTADVRRARFRRRSARGSSRARRSRPSARTCSRSATAGTSRASANCSTGRSGEEADEAGRSSRGSAGGVPRRPQPGRGGQEVSGARHLYVHLPFCAARCGYCDFVTVVGREGRHGEYVDALIAELELERGASVRGSRDGLPRGAALRPLPRRTRSDACCGPCRIARS